MLPLRRQVVALALGLMAAGGLQAAEWKLPPVAGELSGNITALKAPGAPRVEWRVTARDAGGGERELSLALDGPGARLRATARLDAAANGTWRIEEGTIDLATWFATGLELLTQRSLRFTLTGVVEISGEGTVREGKLGGSGRMRLKGGRFDIPARKLLLEDLEFELAFEDLATVRTAPAQRLTWKGGKYGEITLGAGRFDFAVTGDRVEVVEATIDVFAGQLSLGGFGFSLDQPVTNVTAKVRALEMAMLLPFMPSIVSQARGRLDGKVQLRWDADGLAVGDGELALRQGETAEISFLPQPGLLAGSLPPALTKIYTGLADLEQGKMPIKADRLEVTLTPKGDAEGRNAVVHLAGGPADPRLVAPLDLTFNVRAPIDWLVNFGSKIH